MDAQLGTFYNALYFNASISYVVSDIMNATACFFLVEQLPCCESR